MPTPRFGNALGFLKETMVVPLNLVEHLRLTQEDGRDHWPYGFTAFLAGGGVKGGTVYGKMDKVGKKSEEGKFVDPASLNATIAHAHWAYPLMMFNTHHLDDLLP